jgi:hypothetical protein
MNVSGARKNHVLRRKKSFPQSHNSGGLQGPEWGKLPVTEKQKHFSFEEAVIEIETNEMETLLLCHGRDGGKDYGAEEEQKPVCFAWP